MKMDFDMCGAPNEAWKMRKGRKKYVNELTSLSQKYGWHSLGTFLSTQRQVCRNNQNLETEESNDGNITLEKVQMEKVNWENGKSLSVDSIMNELIKYGGPETAK